MPVKSHMENSMEAINVKKDIRYDMVVMGLVFLLVVVIVSLAKRFDAPFVPQAHISLDPINLFKYSFFSAMRGFIAYGFSLLFTLIIGYLAAKNRFLEKIIIPTLDILQSVPVLGFLPGLMLALIAIFPHREIGIELVAIFMIFTGQVWNMTFSFYQSLKSVPKEMIEVAKIYNMSKWQIFWNIELPYATPGLVWNSMMSMAGGWFFLTVCEAFTLGNQTYSIPGIGSYMALAINKGYVLGQIYGIFAMICMILVIDILFWKPISIWAEKFSLKNNTIKKRSFLLDILVKSHIVKFFREVSKIKLPKFKSKSSQKHKPEKTNLNKNNIYEKIFLIINLFIIIYVLYRFYLLVEGVKMSELIKILSYDGITAIRVYGSILLSILWTLPVGIMIGKSPKLSNKLRSIIQVMASFPAPLIYPWFVMLFPNINYSSVLLMMLGTQWYILFNVIAGASMVPSHLEEVSKVFGFSKLKKLFTLYIPVVSPYLVTGIITAAGGAWNASIVAEYMNVKNKVYEANGIGALINDFTNSGQMHLLAISIVVMSMSVVFINRMIWRPLQAWVTQKYSLGE